jgi:hypothetical protein
VPFDPANTAAEMLLPFFQREILGGAKIRFKDDTQVLLGVVGGMTDCGAAQSSHCCCGRKGGRTEADFLWKPHDNHFSGDDVFDWLGENGFAPTMRC